MCWSQGPANTFEKVRFKETYLGLSIGLLFLLFVAWLVLFCFGGWDFAISYVVLVCNDMIDSCIVIMVFFVSEANDAIGITQATCSMIS